MSCTPCNVNNNSRHKTLWPKKPRADGQRIRISSGSDVESCVYIVYALCCAVGNGHRILVHFPFTTHDMKRLILLLLSLFGFTVKTIKRARVWLYTVSSSSSACIDHRPCHISLVARHSSDDSHFIRFRSLVLSCIVCTTQTYSICRSGRLGGNALENKQLIGF